MFPLKPVVGLSGRHAQIAIYQFRVKGVQERSVMKQESAFSLLGIARAFPAGHGYVAGAGQFDAGMDSQQAIAHPIEDEPKR